MELKSVEDTSWLQLFIKNTALCKHEMKEKMNYEEKESGRTDAENG